MKTFLKKLIQDLFANLEREISTTNLVPIRTAQEQNPRRLNSGFQDIIIVKTNNNRANFKKIF